MSKCAYFRDLKWKITCISLIWCVIRCTWWCDNLFWLQHKNCIFGEKFLAAVTMVTTTHLSYINGKLIICFTYFKTKGKKELYYTIIFAFIVGENRGLNVCFFFTISPKIYNLLICKWGSLHNWVLKWETITIAFIWCIILNKVIISSIFTKEYKKSRQNYFNFHSYHGYHHTPFIYWYKTYYLLYIF